MKCSYLLQLGFDIRSRSETMNYQLKEKRPDINKQKLFTVELKKDVTASLKNNGSDFNIIYYLNDCSPEIKAI